MNNFLTSRQMWFIGIATFIIGLPIFFVWDKFSSYTATQKIDESGNKSKSIKSLADSSLNVPVKKFEPTSLWFEQSLRNDKNQIHAIFTQTTRVNENGISETCHGCGAVIGVVTYTKVNGKWEFASMQPEIAELGQWGGAPEVKQAKVLQLAPDNVALLIHETSLNQGYYTSWIDLLAYSNNKWKNLISVEMGVINDGDCSNPPPLNKNEEDYGRCWSYKGKVSMKAGNNPKYPDLLITQIGTKGGEDKMQVVPVNRVITYIFNGEKYIASKAN